MAIGSNGSGGDEDEVIASINTTPLVDVMLVLLIIFLITIPVVTHNVAVRLPSETHQPRQTKPENINITVDKDGSVFWNNLPVAGNKALVTMLKQASVRDPQPEVHIRGDRDARYASIGRVVLACQRAGVRTVSFITEPQPNGQRQASWR
ncbi:MAG: biopolymer transporter ExbD [Burkholderiaceae bacterium]|nr:biopolymer transporter ExbD [Burkholderiaceae bacterium]